MKKMVSIRGEWGLRGGRSGWRLLEACAVLVATGLLLFGCEDLQDANPENLPPETFLAQVGDLDTVNSHVVLNWWGQDPDGEVKGFYTRWSFNFGLPDSSTTGWVFTTAYQDTFALPALITPGGDTTFGRHRFRVKAVDEQDLEDPTPVEQVYSVFNQTPSIRFKNPGTFPLVSFPAFTILWETDDEDGLETVSHYLAWLDGQTDTIVVPAPDTIFTYQPGDFEGRYGTRTLFLRAIDDADVPSNTLSYTWDVIEPIGSVILIDDTPGGALSTVSDPFYRDNLDSVLGPGTYSILDTDGSAFRTPDEAAAILSLFDKVVWYQGAAAPWNTPDVNKSLANAAGAIEDLLLRGGSILLESMNAFGTDGALSDTFATDYLDIASFFIYPNLDPLGRTGTTNHPVEVRSAPDTAGVRVFWKIDGDSLQGLHDIRPRGIFAGVECFDLAPGADTLYTIPPDITFFGQPDGYHVGVKGQTVQGGRIVYLGFPLSRCDLFRPGDPGIFNDDDLRLLLRRELGF